MAIPFNKEVILEAIREVISEHETGPNLELQVGDYQTKHYHMCPGAKTLYQDIESKVEDMDLAVRAAKLQDALFAMEEMALERGATEADVFAAEAVASQIMGMAEMMGLAQEHSYIQGHVDKIKAASTGVDENTTEVPTADGTEKTATPDQKKVIMQARKNGTPLSFRKKGDIQPAMEEMISVGHVDDEPGMLKQYAFDTAEYAVKLYKLLHHYEQMEDHVDFPNWWQHKVMMAREYMSKATHYLEFETMKPHLDAKIDGHSEEELAEDYVPHTKEDLVFQYLRDAWQFGAMKGKDVNPDEELSTMADSLLANLPEIDAQINNAPPEVDLEEARDYQALVGQEVMFGSRYATVVGEEGDYIRLKFEDGKENLVTKKDFENKQPGVNEKFLKEDDVEAPATGFEDDSAKAPKGDKKLNKAASKDDKIISAFQKIQPLFKKAAAGDKEALAIVKANQDVIKAYKKMKQKHLTESKATCCGRCGRTHVKGTECKKPFLTGKDHCRVR
jgi:hypothetical protein